MQIRRLLPLVVLLSLFPAKGKSQSLLDRSPNVSGDWVGSPGTVFFHFVHRFVVGEAPARKVTNIPTLLLAAGLPGHLLAGLDYSSNSTLSSTKPNETELFARWQPISEDYGAPVTLGGEVAYNTVAKGVDGEVSAAKRFGIARFIIAGRALSNPLESGKRRFAVAGGATLRVSEYVALAGDVATLTDKDSAERVAWSAGIHMAIPQSPHTFSLQVSNAAVTTLQGASRGASKLRYGFEFTIPLTLRRYFGKRAVMTDTAVSATAPVDTAVQVTNSAETAVQPVAPEPVAAPPAPAIPPPTETASAPVVKTAEPPKPAPVVSKPAASIRRTTIKNISYLQSRITVPAGTTVVWTNSDPLAHSVTADNGSFNSGLIEPGKTYRHTFTKPGTYNFHCIPHPFMKGVIVVTAQ